MEGLGQKLKEARESRGLTLRDVEEATKIRKKYLQALENENFDVIPGRTYAKGFLKNYSKFLDLDTQEMLEGFEEALSKSFKDSDFTPITTDVSDASPSLKQGRLFKFGLVVAAILVLFISSSLLNNFTDNEDPTPPNPAGVNEPSSTGPEEENEPPENIPESSGEPEEKEPPEVIQGVKLEIEIVKDQCWVRVISDGRESFSGTLNQGDKRVFEGDSEIVLTLGNAGAAKVTYNGEELPPLGEDWEVVTPDPFVSKDNQT